MKQYIVQFAFTLLIAFTGTLVILGVVKLIEYREPFIELSKAVDNSSPEYGDKDDDAAVRFAIATIESAESMFLMYHDLVRNIGQNISKNEAIILHSSYHDIRMDIQNKNVDVAFVCTGTYIHPSLGQNVKPLVRPVFKSEYRGLIIVPSNSPVNTLDDLKGRTIAFTDHESFSGFIIPSMAIADIGHELGSFFGEVIFTGIHDRAILAVSKGIVDCAGINSLVFESMVKIDPTIAERVRILWSSHSYGGPAVIVRSDIEDELEEMLRKEFLTFHETQEGRDILSSIHIEKFVIVNEQDYQTARELYRRHRNLRHIPWI